MQMPAGPDRVRPMLLKTRHLAVRLGVSEKTVRRDMKQLGLESWGTAEAGGRGLAFLIEPTRQQLVGIVHNALKHIHRASCVASSACAASSRLHLVRHPPVTV